jgi:uncharacterized protein (TIGR00730 family)
MPAPEPDDSSPTPLDTDFWGPDQQWGRDGVRSSEARFLQGPRPRGSELIHAFRIFWELLRGFRALHFIGPCVTVFGSARFKDTHPYYKLGVEVGAALGRAGFSVMTGGGPGIMEAANRGARSVGATSVGLNIELPKEQKPNAYLDRFIEFQHFYVRKVMMVKYSYAFVVMPGGFGTLDEAFETLTLIQTSKIKDFPFVFIGRSFWEPLVKFLRETLLAGGTIDPNDLDLLWITDSPDDAVAQIRERALRQFGLSYGPRAKRRWYLLER